MIPTHATLGALPGSAGTRFTVWAPDAQHVEVEIRSRPGYVRRRLERAGDGTHGGMFQEVRAGDRYGYYVNGSGPFPDPASRYQPEGVHAASEVVDPRAFAWHDAGWPGVALRDLVVYELHVGTFTAEGTFAAATATLPGLAALGVTAVELMPLADFAGSRNWGYDGVALFAPCRCYGRPDDLRRFVDEAHRLGLAVLIDVVYNHFGPEGAYHAIFSPYYYSQLESPWGRAMSLDGPHSSMVRRFFVENALHWICEYHADGLRLDATHALLDRSARHLVTELSAAVRDAVPGRCVLLIAEDHRNLATMIVPEERGGWGLDAVWADDFHHQVRRRTAGDDDGYYRDFTGSMEDLAATIRHGWFFRGQYSTYLGRARGTDASGLPLDRFVVCVQNHDQVGNRAFGDRLHHAMGLPLYRAVTVLLLGLPETPLLFMGQEWAASTPFLYFTDLSGDLGPLVTAGRRREFERFVAFRDPLVRERIPDPQARETLEASRLRWEERDREPHASVWRLYQRMLTLRRSEPAVRGGVAGEADATAHDPDTLVLRRPGDGCGAPLVIVVRFAGPGGVELDPVLPGAASGWMPLLTTEDADVAPDRTPIGVAIDGARVMLHFDRPGAVILKGVGR